MEIKKAVIACDSYKGSLSADEVCTIISEGIKAHFNNAQTVILPVADGGEGTIAAVISACGGNIKNVRVKNAFFEEIDCFYGETGDSAVIEMAACAGLPQAAGRENPLITTTYGVGELVLDAVESGYKKIIIGLGGSCTNDLGCGAASALGVKFYNSKGETFVPVGGTLCEIEDVDISGAKKLLEGVEITLMCDVKNPLYGKNGAAYVFAPQKGADEKKVELLDKGLKYAADVCGKTLGMDFGVLEGGGAAGGMGAGLTYFIGAKTRSGIETLLDLMSFDDVVSDADIVFTGEGKTDSQTAGGKAVHGIALRAKKAGVPVVVISGGVDYDADVLYEYGVTAMFPIMRLPGDLKKCIENSKKNLRYTVDNIIRLVSVM